MKTSFFLFFLMVIILSNYKAQITHTLPSTIPEYNGTFEDFGQNHFWYPVGDEIQFENEDYTLAEEQVSYYSKYTYPRQYLLNNRNISLVFNKIDKANQSDSLHRIDVEMYDSNPYATLARVDTQNTCVLNYFTQQFSSSGRTDVRGGAAIAIEHIWDKIDMVYCSNNYGLKIFYVIWPGGDLTDLVLHINGAKGDVINGNNLDIEANWNTFSFVKPKMYQYTQVGNVVTPFNVCNANWNSLGGSKYGISTNNRWDNQLPLIIQISQGPSIVYSNNSLNWSTYFGGGLTDYIHKSKVDALGNLYVAGETISANFPQATGAIPVQANLSPSSYDGFIAKFNNAGILQWSTYVGGAGTDRIYDFDFKGVTEVFCVGYTTSWITLPTKTKTGAFNASLGGGSSDAFIFELTSNGQTNNWLTFLGGNGLDKLSACMFDSNGDFFALGSSSSTNLTPVGGGGTYQQNYNSGQQSQNLGFDIVDGLIVKFDGTSCVLNWLTYYGSDTRTIPHYSVDDFFGMDIVGTNIFAVGYSGGNNLPNALNNKSSGSYTDGMIVNFSTSGAFIASRYTDNVLNTSVKVFNGKVYTVGQTDGGMTTVNSGSYYYDSSSNGGFDTDFMAHSLDLQTTLHATYIGGSGSETAIDLQFTPSNGVFFISGVTNSSNFPSNSLASTYNMTYGGANDYFILAMNEGNSNIVWGTFFGSPTGSEGNLAECIDASLVVDTPNQNLFLCGSSSSHNDFPLDNSFGIPYFQQTRAGLPLTGDGADGTISLFDLTDVNIYVSTKENKIPVSFGLYPNPTSNYLLINNQDLKNKNLTYSIYNVTGQKLSEGNLKSNEEQNIDVSKLSQGVYIINVSTGTKIYSNKFIKNNE